MKTAARRRQSNEVNFEARYSAALSTYVAQGGEAPLRQAYELGREAIDHGRSSMEIAALHHSVFAELFNRTSSECERAVLARAATEFLVESLSPYEMAQRGFQDAVKALRRMNETLEEEIKRIAFAVHNEAAQMLVAVHLALDEISRDLPKAQQVRLKKIEELLNQVESQLRRYSHELRPTVLDDLGWIPAIRFLADGISKRSSVPIQIKTTVTGRLPTTMEITLYRVLQEALTNAARHAKATRITIQVQKQQNILCCSIRDDGVGFNVQAVQNDHKRAGLGLVGMQERLQAIGGTLSILSAPGRGTNLLIRLPLRRNS